MARSAIVVVPDGFRHIEGLQALQRKIAGLPDGVAEGIKPELEKGADQLVDKIKSITPVSDLEASAGELRDSIRKEPGDHELSVRIVEDGHDEKGHPIAAYVNYGHKARDGSHVPAKPHFWPAYNVLKKKLKARMSRAFNKAAKAHWAKGNAGSA